MHALKGGRRQEYLNHMQSGLQVGTGALADGLAQQLQGNVQSQDAIRLGIATPLSLALWILRHPRSTT